MSSDPVGVFDSGAGGLSILAGIHEVLPRESLLYVADSRHAPYGPKDRAFVIERCEAIMRYFVDAGAKAVVVACNTATGAAIEQLRQAHALPIIGVEPALKPAAQQSISGVVGVLATGGTIASDKYLNLQSRFDQQVEVITCPCNGLVEAIEAPVFDETRLRELLVQYIDPMLARGVDMLVLGCTHYSLIKAQIQQVAGAQVAIIDAGVAVARELERRLEEGGLLNTGTAGDMRFLTSGDPAAQAALLGRYWGSPVAVGVLPA